MVWNWIYGLLRNWPCKLKSLLEHREKGKVNTQAKISFLELIWWDNIRDIYLPCLVCYINQGGIPLLLFNISINSWDSRQIFVHSKGWLSVYWYNSLSIFLYRHGVLSYLWLICCNSTELLTYNPLLYRFVSKLIG